MSAAASVSALELQGITCTFAFKVFGETFAVNTVFAGIVVLTAFALLLDGARSASLKRV